MTDQEHLGLSGASNERNSAPRYQLRRTRKAFMIDKLEDQLDFPGEPFWVRVRSFGPFRTKEQATAFMVRNRRP